MIVHFDLMSRVCVPWPFSWSSSSTRESRQFLAAYVGVDVFFVISGFVITGVLLARASLIWADFHSLVLRTALSSDHPGGDTGDHRHRGIGLLVPWHCWRHSDRHRWAVGGRLSGQLSFHRHRHELSDLTATAFAPPELLVPCR